MIHVWRYFILAVTVVKGWMVAKCTFGSFLVNMARSLFFLQYGRKPLFLCNTVRSLFFILPYLGSSLLSQLHFLFACNFLGKLHFRPKNIDKTLFFFQEISFSWSIFSLIYWPCAIEKFYPFSPSCWDSTLALFSQFSALVVQGNQHQRQEISGSGSGIGSSGGSTSAQQLQQSQQKQQQCSGSSSESRSGAAASAVGQVAVAAAPAKTAAPAKMAVKYPCIQSGYLPISK